MNRSDQINELANAFSAAQAVFPPIPKRGVNPHLRNRYSTLDDLISAVRDPLAANGLSFTQFLDIEDGKTVLVTMLMHTSGQFIFARTPVEAMEPNKGTNAMQAFGSTLSYLRRYTIASLLGVTSDDDDDGNGSRKEPQEGKQPIERKAAPAELMGPALVLSGVADTSDYAGAKTLTGMLVSDLAPQYLLPLLAKYAEDMKKEKDKGKLEAMSLAARAANYRWAHILEEDLSPEHRAGLIEYLDGFNSLGEYAQRVLDTLKGKEE